METAAGVLEGIEREGTRQFLGVPYAAAPVGERRFLAPVPAEPWAGVRRADASRTSPPQMVLPAMFGPAEQPPIDEDCLELNIYTPAGGGARLPVMVWFYGGGFIIGSAATYDASSLAARGGVVVVTVNYRLGALGYSYLQHLDERFAGSANAALRDQIASLRWVRDNIAAFGGDPGCVTIFGESAGGHSAGCLLVSPEATGLFHRAILQSSAGWRMRSPQRATEITAQLMSAVGATTVEELQAIDVDTLLAAQAGLMTDPVGPFVFAPTPDGVVLNGAVIDEAAAGRSEPVPLLITHTRDELQLYAGLGLMPDLPDDEDALADRLTQTWPDPRAAIDAYRTAEPELSPPDWFVSYMSDQIHMPDFRLADVRSRHDPRVWMARFSWASPADGGKWGACHGIEIPFLFWRPGQTGAFLGEHEPPVELAHAMQDAWATFARTGDPNSPGLPSWPRYEPDRRAVMELDTESRVVDDPDGTVRAAWEDVDLTFHP